MKLYARAVAGGYRRKPRHEIRTEVPGGIGFLMGVCNCGDADEDAKHARLFATAPDLLEALRYADEQAPANNPDQDDSDLITIEVTAGWVRELREAIAKATTSAQRSAS